VFNKENPLNPKEQHHSYCPVIDKIFPLWHESLQNMHKLKVCQSSVQRFSCSLPDTKIFPEKGIHLANPLECEKHVEALVWQ
jgi:hypothetical protein